MALPLTVLFLVFRNYKTRGAVLQKLTALKINQFTAASVCSMAYIWFYVKSSGVNRKMLCAC